jgi:hypothetical protein
MAAAGTYALEPRSEGRDLTTSDRSCGEGQARELESVLKNLRLETSE